MVVDSKLPEPTTEKPVAEKPTSEEAKIKKGRAKTKRCPYCDERIPYEAIKCYHCKEFLDKPIKS